MTLLVKDMDSIRCIKIRLEIVRVSPKPFGKALLQFLGCLFTFLVQSLVFISQPLMLHISSNPSYFYLIVRKTLEESLENFVCHAHHYQYCYQWTAFKHNIKFLNC